MADAPRKRRWPKIVAALAVLLAIGAWWVDRQLEPQRLTAQVLALRVPIYDPRIHYHQIRDVWFGVRTPDGR